MILQDPPVLDRPPTAAQHLQSFGEAIRLHLGLAQPARNLDSLERRLRAAMEASGYASDPEGFLLELRRAGPDSPLLDALADVVPNRETSFFRDVAQLRGFTSSLMRRPSEGSRLRILSAGCATGEEAYSLAMLCFENQHLSWGRPFHVHGVDVSNAAIRSARRGVFRPHAFVKAGQGPEGWRDRYFRKGPEEHAARDLLRAAVTFQRANLVDPSSLELLGGFDAVVCRNVLIYFDPETLRSTVDRLLRLLRPGGVLLLGHAESGLVDHLDHLRERVEDNVWFTRSKDG